jgi:ABC-type uncharacterized transport system permease subunit
VLGLLERVNFTGCYQTQLRAVGRNEVGNGMVRIEVEEDGRIRVLSVGLPAALKPAGGCVSQQLQGQAIAAPDTGTVVVEINIAFGIQ